MDQYMPSNWYPNTQKFLLPRKDAPKLLQAFSEFPPRYSSLSVAVFVFSMDLALFWYPPDMVNHQLSILNRRYLSIIRESDMERSKFVYNNLSEAELKQLDKEYPDIETLDKWASAAIDANMNFAVRADRDGGYIVFGNQDSYAVAGRSGTAFDAFVIALFKCVKCGFDLSSADTGKVTTKRG